MKRKIPNTKLDTSDNNDPGTKQKRIRGSNFSKSERAIFVKLLSIPEHSIIFSRKINRVTNLKKQECWNAIAAKFSTAIGREVSASSVCSLYRKNFKPEMNTEVAKIVALLPPSCDESDPIPEDSNAIFINGGSVFEFSGDEEVESEATEAQEVVSEDEPRLRSFSSVDLSGLRSILKQKGISDLNISEKTLEEIKIIYNFKFSPRVPLKLVDIKRMVHMLEVDTVNECSFEQSTNAVEDCESHLSLDQDLLDMKKELVRLKIVATKLKIQQMKEKHEIELELLKEELQRKKFDNGR